MNTFYFILFSVFATIICSEEEELPTLLKELAKPDLDPKDREIARLKAEKIHMNIQKDNEILTKDNEILAKDNEILRQNISRMQPYVERDTENMCYTVYSSRLWRLETVARNADILNDCIQLRQTIVDLLPTIKKKAAVVGMLLKIMKPYGQRPQGIIKGEYFTDIEAFRILISYAVLHMDEKEEQILRVKHSDLYNFLMLLRDTFSCSKKKKDLISYAVELKELYIQMPPATKDHFKQSFQFMKMTNSLPLQKKNGGVQTGNGPTDGRIERSVPWLNANVESDPKIYVEILHLVFWLTYKMDPTDLPKLKEFDEKIGICAENIKTLMDGFNDLSTGFKLIFGDFRGRVKRPGDVISEDELKKAIELILRRKEFKNDETRRICLDIMLNFSDFTTPKSETDHTAHYV